MAATTITMAPRIEMATCVSRPANSSVTPTLSAIGYAVGAGSTTDGVAEFRTVCGGHAVVLPVTVSVRL